MAIKINGDNLNSAVGLGSGDDDSGIKPGSNTVEIVTGGTTRVKVDSSGRALIGGNEPVTANFGSAKLQVNNDSDRVASFMHATDNNSGPHVNLVKSRGGATDLSNRKVLNNNDELGRLNWIGDDGNDLGCDGAAIIAKIDGTPSSNVMPTKLLFFTNDGVQFAEERMKIGKDGNVTITDGNLVIGTGGHGIDFSAQTATSKTGAAVSANGEILDHYEEGTWTPVPRFNGNSHVMQTNVSGFYTRIGRVVTAHFLVTFTAKGTSTGAFRLENLPFTSVDNFEWTNSGFGFLHRTALPQTAGQVTGSVVGDKVSFRLAGLNGGNSVLMDDADLNNDSDIRGSVTYMVAT